MKRICVFCGSSAGARPEYADAARKLGEALARQKLALVYGGGCVGLMGILADSALAAGGAVIGVIPQALATKELMHAGLTELRVVATMHERKAAMAELSDAFVALPGGFGTLEEFCEVLTWAQLGFHRKPCGLLNVHGYFKPLLALFDHAVAEKFVTPAQRTLVIEAAQPEDMLATLAAFKPPHMKRWVEREEL